MKYVVSYLFVFTLVEIALCARLRREIPPPPPDAVAAGDPGASKDIPFDLKLQFLGMELDNVLDKMEEKQANGKAVDTNKALALCAVIEELNGEVSETNKKRISDIVDKNEDLPENSNPDSSASGKSDSKSDSSQSAASGSSSSAMSDSDSLPSDKSDSDSASSEKSFSDISSA